MPLVAIIGMVILFAICLIPIVYMIYHDPYFERKRELRRPCGLGGIPYMKK